MGMGWQLPFHPDDMTTSGRKWAYSLKTGAPYSTEYRCRTKGGEWRWMLGRALPMRNKQTGAIEKWFGTCTDIHEAVESRFAARRTVTEFALFARHRHWLMILSAPTIALRYCARPSESFFRRQKSQDNPTQGIIHLGLGERSWLWGRERKW